MIKELTLSRYIKQMARIKNINFICPLCSRPLKTINHNNHVIQHIRDHHYELSDLWFQGEPSDIIDTPKRLELIITEIWKNEFHVFIIEFIGRLLDNYNILNQEYYKHDLEIKKHRIKKLREISMQLTS